MTSIFLDKFDGQLAPYYNMVLNFFNIDPSMIPLVFRKPVRFGLLLIGLLLSSAFFMDYLLCMMIGILYPMLYSYYLIKNSDINSDTNSIESNLRLLKYWVFYSFVHIMEFPLLFILRLIPGYFYLKISVFYLLIKNNFSLINLVYTYVEKIIDIFVSKSSLFSKIKTAEEFRNKVREVQDDVTLNN